MPRVDVVVESKIGRSSRVAQLEAMFDVPAVEKSRLAWSFDAPFESQPWNVGLIVGPSGSGKTVTARNLFAKTFHPPLKWKAASVVDDFARSLEIAEISKVCQAVGFNTIPAWMRPFAVLSNGEQFRVELARRLIELPDPVVVDEFSSVVDRQVAKIASHAVQKYVRRNGRKFVAVSCHYDIVDWLQPDWIIEPAKEEFLPRGSLQRRPDIACSIDRVDLSAWKLFAPFHYLTATLNRSARCFALFVDDQPAAFAGVLPRPHKTHRNIIGLSRLVTLPDWQGLGLALILAAQLGGAYRSVGARFHVYPAHPALIRGFGARPDLWEMIKRPGFTSPINTQATSAFGPNASNRTGQWTQGARPCATFRYVGPGFESEDDARRLINGD